MATCPALLQGVTEVPFNPFENEDVVLWMLAQKLARIRTPAILEALRQSTFELHVPHVPRKSAPPRARVQTYWAQYFGSSPVPESLPSTCCRNQARQKQRNAIECYIKYD